MEKHSNKTIMSSVLFLDIVEYSKKSVSGQISLKDRFNSYLSAAIRDVPISDRIILDTGDGAAINFLGDVEDALKAALSLRESLRNENVVVDTPLLVRAGINLGPVRLVRDINGQPNIVGDGINVAQRVMGFASVNQTLVSRSYYDAVSRLSPQYTGMFHYMGSRTDKHVREHEVYVIGYPGEQTSELAVDTGFQEQHGGQAVDRLAPVKAVWKETASRLDGLLDTAVIGFAKADVKQRSMYIAALLAVVVLGSAIIWKLLRHDRVPVPQAELPLVGVQPASAVSTVEMVMPADRPAVAQSEASQPEPVKNAVRKPKPNGHVTHSATQNKKTEVKQIEAVVEVNKKAPDQTKSAATPTKQTKSEPTEKKSWLEALSGKENQGADGSVSVSCDVGTQVFVDGTYKGKLESNTLNVNISPGMHTVIVSNTAGVVHSQRIQIDSGKTVRLKPNFCQ